MNEVIGKCSKCGGRVVVPREWMGTQPPIPVCRSCGAKKKSNLPIVEME